LADLLGKCEEVCIPLPVLAEFKSGLLCGSRRQENEALLHTFMAKPSVRLILPSRETAEHYARLYAQLKIAGTPVPINDLWIAALSIEHDLTLISRDHHFQRFPQLLVI
jgi:tRNA(fMet)-specific endonuclease VapC